MSSNTLASKRSTTHFSRCLRIVRDAFFSAKPMVVSKLQCQKDIPALTALVVHVATRCLQGFKALTRACIYLRGYTERLSRIGNFNRCTLLACSALTETFPKISSCRAYFIHSLKHVYQMIRKLHHSCEVH